MQINTFTWTCKRLWTLKWLVRYSFIGIATVFSAQCWNICQHSVLWCSYHADLWLVLSQDCPDFVVVLCNPFKLLVSPLITPFHDTPFYWISRLLLTCGSVDATNTTFLIIRAENNCIWRGWLFQLHNLRQEKGSSYTRPTSVH